MHGVLQVAVSGVGVMDGLVVLARLEASGRLSMVLGGVLVVLGGHSVVLDRSLRHGYLPLSLSYPARSSNGLNDETVKRS